MEGLRHVLAALPPGNGPGIYCTGGRLILRTGLDVCGKFRPRSDSNTEPSSSQRVTSISKMQSNTAFNIYIAKRCFYIACPTNYMFRPLYRPSSDCTLSYYKANCTVYNVFCFCRRYLVHTCKIYLQNNYSSSRIKMLF